MQLCRVFADQVTYGKQEFQAYIDFQSQCGRNSKVAQPPRVLKRANTGVVPETFSCKSCNPQTFLNKHIIKLIDL